MADITAPSGVAILTTSTTIYTNPTGTGARNVLARINIVNVDGAVDAALNTCIFRDSSASANFQVLPINYLVKKLDGVSFEKILEPGDYIAASASAAGDLLATVDLFWEPA